MFKACTTIAMAGLFALYANLHIAFQHHLDVTDEFKEAADKEHNAAFFAWERQAVTIKALEGLYVDLYRVLDKEKPKAFKKLPKRMSDPRGRL